MSMQKTRANLTIPRVAASGLTSAQEWLGRQIAWEDRLAELERGDVRRGPVHEGVLRASA
jgi:hypothetical protein